MTHRFVALAGVVGIVVAVGLLALVPVAAQAPAKAKTWTAASRTPDGQPDLQGFWTNTTYTSLERPKNVTKEFYTNQEALESEKRAAAAENGADDTEPGTIADVHYNRSQFDLGRNQGGLVLNLRTSLIVDPPDGKIPPMTAEGQKRTAQRLEARKRMGAATDAVQNQPYSARCILLHDGAPMLGGGYNNNYQFVQIPGYVMILAEMLHDVRVIPLDGRPHLPPNVRQWLGDSRGHWEGQTLVVETTNFTDKTAFRGSSENMRLTERFTRTDEDTIRYQFTVDDPATWPRPWSAEAPWKKTIGPLFEHACHEGNYGLYNTLAGARAEEKRAVEEAAKKASK